MRLCEEETQVHVERDLLVAMRDGVRLATDVFRPVGAGRCPTLIKRTPYGKKHAELLAAETIADLVDHGYAVVVQDVRGRSNSEGEWLPFVHEMDDGADTITWAAAQTWSTGRVGMFGISYMGLTQLLAAAACPPSLAAIAPGNAPSDLRRNWVYSSGGALDLLLSVAWAAAAAGDTARRNGIADSRLDEIEAGLGQFIEALGHGPHATFDASAQLRTKLAPFLRDPGELEHVAPWLRGWLAQGPDDTYWEDPSPSSHYADMKVPALHITGWYDAFVGGVVANYTGMARQAATAAARANQRLIVGPWPHASFEPCPPHVVGEVDFGAAADIDLRAVQHQWFDRWLKDEHSSPADEAPVRIFVMGENRWRDEMEWPLGRTRWRRWYLRSRGHANTLDGDGQLCIDASPSSEPPDRYAYMPDEPVPTLGGALLPGAALAGPYDQRANERRADVLVYTSEPLAFPLEVTGSASVLLWVASTSGDTCFTARLVDVHPSGLALNVPDGITRVRPETSANRSISRRTRIELSPTSIVFHSGHRLRLEVSSSSYPHFAVNPIAAEQWVYHDAAHASHVLLPTIPAD